MKIAIIGYSGSGKSTLARHISKTMNIPVLHLDKVNWIYGWNERDKNDQLNIVRNFLDENSSWIIDGNYSKLFYKERLISSDSIIFMNFSRINCLFRVINRRIKYSGKTREDMGEGCPEKIDYEFLKWILLNGRTKPKRKNYKGIISDFGEKVTVINNQKQLNALYRSLEQGGEYGKSL